MIQASFFEHYAPLFVYGLLLALTGMALILLLSLLRFPKDLQRAIQRRNSLRVTAGTARYRKAEYREIPPEVTALALHEAAAASRATPERANGSIVATMARNTTSVTAHTFNRAMLTPRP